MSPRISQKPVSVVSDTGKKGTGVHPLFGLVVPPNHGKTKHPPGVLGVTPWKGHHIFGVIALPSGGTAPSGSHFVGVIAPQPKAPKNKPIFGLIVNPNKLHPPGVMLGRLVGPDGKNLPSGSKLTGTVSTGAGAAADENIVSP